MFFILVKALLKPCSEFMKTLFLSRGENFRMLNNCLMNKLLSFINLGAHWKMRKTMEMCRTQLIILTRIPCSDIFEFIYNLLVITYKLWVQTGQNAIQIATVVKKFYSVRTISLRINKNFNLFLLIRLLIVFQIRYARLSEKI